MNILGEPPLGTPTYLPTYLSNGPPTTYAAHGPSQRYPRAVREVACPKSDLSLLPIISHSRFAAPVYTPGNRRTTVDFPQYRNLRVR